MSRKENWKVYREIMMNEDIYHEVLAWEQNAYRYHFHKINHNGFILLCHSTDATDDFMHVSHYKIELKPDMIIVTPSVSMASLKYLLKC